MAVGQRIVVGPALLLGPEPESPLLAAPGAADELVPVGGQAAPVALVGPASGSERLVVVSEEGGLQKSDLGALDDDPDAALPPPGGLAPRMLLKLRRGQLAWERRRDRIGSSGHIPNRYIYIYK